VVLEWLQNLGTLLTVGASLIAIGVTAGALPRLSKSIDDHKEADRKEKDLLWSDVRRNERDLAHFKTEVARQLPRGCD
jgi:hypothetical protein